MVSRTLSELRSRFKRGASQILSRDEFDPRITRDTIVFLAGLVVLLMVALVIAAIVATFFEQETVASYLLFVLPFLAFIGTVLITWEVLRYRFGPTSPTEEIDQSTVEPGITNRRDVFYLITSLVLGFIAVVIVIELISLMA